MGTLLEGIRAVTLPCTLALLLPALVVAFAVRLRPVPIAAFTGTVAVLVWGTAIGVDLPRGAVGQVLGALVLGSGLVAVGRGTDDRLRGVGAAAVAAVSTLLWVPCVGRALGAALTAAPTDPAAQLLPLALYGIGTMTPVVAAAAVGALAGAEQPWLDRAAAVAAGLGLVLVLILATGTWDDVVGELVRRSSI